MFFDDYYYNPCHYVRYVKEVKNVELLYHVCNLCFLIVVQLSWLPWRRVTASHKSSGHLISHTASRQSSPHVVNSCLYDNYTRAV